MSGEVRLGSAERAALLDSKDFDRDPERHVHLVESILAARLAAVPVPSETGLAAAVEAARDEVDAELICGCVEKSGGVYVKGVSDMPCLYAHFAANIFERHLRALLSERTATTGGGGS